MAFLVDLGMDGLPDHPIAATRYLLHRKPPGRITCLFQGRVRLRGRGPDDRIAPHLPPEEVRADRSRPIWGLTLVVDGTVTVHDRRQGTRTRLASGGWFQFLGRSAQELALEEASPDFREAAVSCNEVIGSHLVDAGLWRTDLPHAAAPPDAALVGACLDLHRALLDQTVAPSGLIRRLAQVLELAYAGADAVGDGFRARACRLLAEHPEPAFAVADAARRLGLGEQVFRKRFRAVVGVAPGTWHQHRRIERATALLATHSVAETARLLGYPDAFALSRQFRRVTGMAPSCLRR